MGKAIKTIPLILLVLAIGLSPGFSAGHLAGGKIIELRAEDLLVFVFGLWWVISLFFFPKEKIERPALLGPVLFWLSICLASFLINYFLVNLSFSKGFFYLLKEIQYFFLYFYFFYNIKDIKAVKAVVSAWFFVAFANIVYIIYQVYNKSIAGNIYQFIIGQKIGNADYGASAIAEEGSLPRGMFFLLIFAFLVNIFLYYYLKSNISKTKKTILGIISLSSFAGVFYSGSRTAFLGLVFVVFLTLTLFILKKKSLKMLYGAVVVLIVILILFFSLPKSFVGPRRIIKTVSSKEMLVSEIYRSRIESGMMPTLKRAMAEKNYLVPFIGFGKGYFGEGHNQYLLNFISTGIIGSFAFFVLIFAIVKKSFKYFLKGKDSLSVGLSTGLLIATLGMLFCSLASDPFLVVKSAETYWSFAGLALAVLSIKKYE